MSEYFDFLYDYLEHTQSSCLNEISDCDMVILIIGGRFGGKSVPQALEQVDIEKLKKKGFANEILDKKEDLSITQLEFFKSIDSGIPVYTLVSSNVLQDYNFWKQNGKNNDLKYPSIEMPETGKHIFGFIDYINSLDTGNSMASFSNIDEIKEFLRKQWAALFRHLLKERQNRIQTEKLQQQTYYRKPRQESSWEIEKRKKEEEDKLVKRIEQEMTKKTRMAMLGAGFGGLP